MLSVLIGLSAMEAVLSSAQATGRVGAALNGIGKVTEYLFDPAYPLVPDRRPAGGGGNNGGQAQGGGGGNAPIVPDPPVILPPAPLPVL